MIRLKFDIKGIYNRSNYKNTSAPFAAECIHTVGIYFTQ